MPARDSLIKKPLSQRGQLILDAAKELFLIHGFDGTSLEMIIEKSGGSRRSIYAEFGNKQGLLFAVIEEQVSQQAGTLKQIDLKKSPKENFEEACFQFIKGLTSPTLIGLLKIALNMVDKEPKIGEIIYENGPLSGTKPLEKYLTFLSEKGELQVDDTEFAAQALVEMCKGKLHIKAMLLPHNPVTDEEIREQVSKVVALFLKAYQK